MTTETIFDAIVGICAFAFFHVGAYMFLDLLTDRPDEPANNVEFPVARIDWNKLSNDN